MAELRLFQPAFTAGVLSPALSARVDLAKYSTGLKTGLNLFIHPHGGVSNRPGLKFINEVKTSANGARIVPFQFNTEQSYILEFGDLYIRVYRDGGVVLSGAAAYEVVTPYAHADLAELAFVQEANAMYLTHPSYPVRKLVRVADDNWTLTEVTFQPAIAPPANVGGSAQFRRRTGGTTNIGYRVSAVGAGGAESAAAAAVAVSVQYEVEDGRFVRLSWTASTGAVLYRVYRSDSSVGILVETTETTVDIPQNVYVGDGTAVPTVADSGAPPTPTDVAGEIVYGKETSYAVAAIDAATGEESLPSDPVVLNNDLAFSGNRNTITWDAVAGASAYIVYREDNGVYGFIGRTENTSFVDENIVPDTADGPQEGTNPFSSAGNYPRCATFIEQRLAFASTENDPQAVWMSQSAAYENFGAASPAKASDAVTFRIKARQVNEIRAMVPTPRGLLALTSGAEWTVTGGSESDIITPTSIKITNEGYRGAARVPPVVVGNTVLFAHARGGVIRDFSYDFASDSLAGKDLTILARHLFEGREIKAWAYAQAPYSIVWVVLDDGALVSLTYMKEHEVWGWTHHESGPSDDAVFEDVAVIAEDGEDVPYFLVKRTINGSSKRYIERLHSRAFDSVEDAFFVDSGLTYSGAATTAISGLDHLENQEVVALADGNVVRGLVVTGGAITLPNAATKAHIGLPMTAALQTLPIDLGQVRGIGTVQGRQKSIAEVVLRVEKTRGIFIGPIDGDRDSAKMVEYKQRSTEAYNEAIGLYTGDIPITPHWSWNTKGDMWIKQFDPLPMTILAFMPDVQIGG